VTGRRYCVPPRKIGGRAKAMVVTASRLHAVRYQQALTSYCREHGYGIGVLVAFSGTVAEGEGPDAQAWTEAKMNGFPDSQTAQQFDADRYQILVVAEKYQTGFDQPLLYAMYVDKGLTGLAAVQALSRLNRPCDGKDGTFVLDFRNQADDIKHSFAPWYAATVSPPTDPNQTRRTRTAASMPRLLPLSTDSARLTPISRTRSVMLWAGSPARTPSFRRLFPSPT
jgi:type I restriction enzyme, R subunit